MSRNVDEEAAGWRQELKDLEEVISRANPPLASRTRAIAEAKIATLQRQLAAINTEPQTCRIETQQSDENKRRTAVVDGWRCDLCGEIATAQERPVVPPQKCSRCGSSNMTSMEEWTARRPPLGLWTR
jgi:hypothetical protein